MSNYKIMRPDELIIELIEKLSAKVEKLSAKLESSESAVLITPSQFEELYGYTPIYQRTLRRQGKLPYKKFGSRVFYDRREIEKHIIENAKNY